MTRTDLTLRRQSALFVRKGPAVSLALWTECMYAGQPRTELAVWRTIRTLLPRDGFARGIREHARGVDRDHVEPWLRERGYEVVGVLDAPAGDEILNRW